MDLVGSTFPSVKAWLIIEEKERNIWNIFKSSGRRHNTDPNDTQFNETEPNDIQHNDTQHNETDPNDIQHNDTQHNGIQHNDTQHNDTEPNDFQHDATQHSDAQLKDTHYNSIDTVMLSVVYAECYLCYLLFMRSVTNKPIILCVIMLSVIALSGLYYKTFYGRNYFCPVVSFTIFCHYQSLLP